MSTKWPILCRVGRKTLTTQSVMERWRSWSCWATLPCSTFSSVLSTLLWFIFETCCTNVELQHCALHQVVQIMPCFFYHAWSLMLWKSFASRPEFRGMVSKVERSDTLYVSAVQYDIICWFQCFDGVRWWQEGHLACKNWVVRYWHGYLSGARCKWSVYGPADATATPSSLGAVKSRMVYLSGASLFRLSWKKGH